MVLGRHCDLGGRGDGGRVFGLPTGHAAHLDGHEPRRPFAKKILGTAPDLPHTGFCDNHHGAFCGRADAFHTLGFSARSLFDGDTFCLRTRLRRRPEAATSAKRAPWQIPRTLSKFKIYFPNPTFGHWMDGFAQFSRIYRKHIFTRKLGGANPKLAVPWPLHVHGRGEF